MALIRLVYYFWCQHPASFKAQRLLCAVSLLQPQAADSMRTLRALAGCDAELAPDVYQLLLRHDSAYVRAAVWSRGLESESAVLAMVAPGAEDLVVQAAGLAYDEFLDEVTFQRLVSSTRDVGQLVVVKYRSLSVRVLLEIVSQFPSVVSHGSWMWARQDMVAELFADAEAYDVVTRLSACSHVLTPVEFVRQTFDGLGAAVESLEVRTQVEKVLRCRVLPNDVLRAGIGLLAPHWDAEASPFGVVSYFNTAVQRGLRYVLTHPARGLERAFAWSLATAKQRQECAALMAVRAEGHEQLVDQALAVLDVKHSGSKAAIDAELAAVAQCSSLEVAYAGMQGWMLDFPQTFCVSAQTLHNKSPHLFVLDDVLDKATDAQLAALFNWVRANLDSSSVVYEAVVQYHQKVAESRVDAVALMDLSFSQAACSRELSLDAAEWLADCAGDTVAVQQNTLRLWLAAAASNPRASIGDVVNACTAAGL